MGQVLAIRMIGLNGGPLSGSPLGELSPCEFPNCPPSNYWWVKPLGTWVSKLMLICIVVSIGEVIYFWISPLSLLIIIWTIEANWFPIECGVYIGGTTSYTSIRYTYPDT